VLCCAHNKDGPLLSFSSSSSKNANLLSRENTLTSQDLQSYRDLVEATTDDLHARLENITDKHDTLDERNAARADDIVEPKYVEEEKLAAEICLQICEQTSEYLDRIQLTYERASDPDDGEAGTHSKETISIIENYGTGDVVQYMVSANDKILHGKNRALGWKARQVGGYLSNLTVRHVSRDMSETRIRTTSESSASTMNDHASTFKKKSSLGLKQKP